MQFQHYGVTRIGRDKKFRDDMLKDFAKKGYDAVVDLEDSSSGFEYPVILIKSEDVTKRIRREKW